MGMKITVAAANSSFKDKERADLVCSGRNDEAVINRAIALLTRGGTVQLLDGDYFIEDFSNEGNSAVCIGYNDGNARVVNITGDTENKSYNTSFPCRKNDFCRLQTGTNRNTGREPFK